MKNQNIYVSVAIIIVAIGLGVYLGHRHVTAPVLPPSSLSTGLGQPDSSLDSTLDPEAGATDGSGASADDTGDKSFTLACDAQKEMMVTFHLPEDQSVDLMLSDGRTMSLDNTSTTTGASYTSADGSDVLALSGSTLSLTENGTATYTNCALDNSASDGVGM